jgi:hypothetical protein
MAGSKTQGTLLHPKISIDEAKNKNKEIKAKVLCCPSARALQEQMTKFPVDFGYEISLPTNNLNFDLLVWK